MRRTALIILSLLGSEVTIAQTADSVLANYFKAVGTKERWIQLTSTVHTYESKRATALPGVNHAAVQYTNGLFYKVAKRNGSTTFVRYFSVQENHPYDTSTSTFNGTDYWFQFANGDPVRQVSDLSEVARNSTLGYPEKLLQAEAYEYVGVKQLDEFLCDIVRVKTKNTEIDYYFDTTTHYLVRYHAKDKPVKTTLKDYRDVNGLKIPFTEEISNEFGVISVNHLVDTRIDLLIDNTYFSKVIGEGLVVK
jgi:hypothetical protein